MLKVKCFKSGDEYCVENPQFQPMDFPRLVDCIANKKSTVITTVTGDQRNEAGKLTGDRLTLGFEAKLNDKVPFFCLVRGGVLPPVYQSELNHQLLVDRNVIGNIQAGTAEFKSELAKFDNSKCEINPLFPCFEGELQRLPSLNEFKAELAKNIGLLKQEFPNAKIHDPDDAKQDILYGVLQDMSGSDDAEKDFLRLSAPLIANQVAGVNLDAIRIQIEGFADQSGVARNSFLFLCVLSNLYERHDTCANTGRRVIKPTATMSDEDIYNVISDIRQIQLFSPTLALPETNFAFFTADIGLALFWAGLHVSEVRETEGIQIDSAPHEDLFPRANAETIKESTTPSSSKMLSERVR